ncbi:HD-GYP domain-containing protein [Acanthopleuribacter pedis]|uniref:HD domain-containing protein n=1 Tax=Acanthopleuribacter pedis TaxID=442870 RepID=A0A8J7U5S6_9BACT|nr:HD domain-containing phosphohydrolase [Acanthopleuribacter pedis]MBO1321164.1 HD domain-containing protein [Acanthopleuribacter pedis]
MSWRAPENCDEINRRLLALEQDLLAVYRRTQEPGCLLTSPAFRFVCDWVDEDPYRGLLMSRIKHPHAFTPRHGINVMLIARAWMSWGHRLGDKRDKHALAALVHDIGHWSQPALLHVFGFFQKTEYRQMQQHARLPDAHSFPEGHPLADPDIRLWIEQHHEQPDGRGYPDGIRDPHVLSQVLRIVDCYEGLTTDRRFRTRYTPHQALRLMARWAGYKFNAGLFKNFQRFVGVFPPGTFVSLVDGRLGAVLPALEAQTCHVLVLTGEEGDPVAAARVVAVPAARVREEAPAWRQVALPEPWRTLRPDLMALPRS